MEIPYRIVQIVTNRFEQHPELLKIGPEIQIQSRFNFAVNQDEHRVLCDSEYQFSQDENMLIGLRLICIFEVEPAAFQGLTDKKDITIPVDFLRYMATICVGTARGILHARTEGTNLNNFVLPPINLVEIIKEPLVVPISGVQEN